MEYIGYSTHYYYVNGNLAYCLEPDMGSPGNGTYPSGEMSSEELLAKAMYYVYGGPGFETYIKPQLTGGWDARTGLTVCHTVFCPTFMTDVIRIVTAL